jgi:nucleolar MIF4G domain-containing protein 1
VKSLRRKVGNVGKTVAYITARGSIDITIFKVSSFQSWRCSTLKLLNQAIDWTTFNALTTLLLRTYLTNLLISSQTASPLFVLPKAYSGFDQESLEEVLEKVLVNGEMVAGLKLFLRGSGSELGRGEGTGEREKKVLEWGVGVISDVLRRGI